MKKPFKEILHVHKPVKNICSYNNVSNMTLNMILRLYGARTYHRNVYSAFDMKTDVVCQYCYSQTWPLEAKLNLPMKR